MDVVKAFNSDLASLYESKPPISKAKMVQITKSAMKAIKYYKHVVMSVEKFIQKCKADYKIPGLYVIDSIVRQSKHQFGAEKDVFAPRFGKNIQQTFECLFNCSDEDKRRVVRVLQLWLKSRVFTKEILDPILEYAETLGLELEDMKPAQKENKNQDQHSHPKEKHHHHHHEQRTQERHKEESVREISTEEIEQPERGGKEGPEPPQEEKLADLISKNPQFREFLMAKAEEILRPNKHAADSHKKKNIKSLLSSNFDYSDEESGEELDEDQQQTEEGPKEIQDSDLVKLLIDFPEVMSLFLSKTETQQSPPRRQTTAEVVTDYMHSSGTNAIPQNVPLVTTQQPAAFFTGQPIAPPPAAPRPSKLLGHEFSSVKPLGQQQSLPVNAAGLMGALGQPQQAPAPQQLAQTPTSAVGGFPQVNVAMPPPALGGGAMLTQNNNLPQAQNAGFPAGIPFPPTNFSVPPPNFGGMSARAPGGEAGQVPAAVPNAPGIMPQFNVSKPPPHMQKPPMGGAAEPLPPGMGWDQREGRGTPPPSGQVFEPFAAADQDERFASRKKEKSDRSSKEDRKDRSKDKDKSRDRDKDERKHHSSKRKRKSRSRSGSKERSKDHKRSKHSKKGTPLLDEEMIKEPKEKEKKKDRTDRDTEKEREKSSKDKDRSDKERDKVPKEKDRDRDRDRSKSRKKHKKASRSRSRSRSKERRKSDRALDKERRKLGLPSLKPNHVIICSRTLFFGRLANNCVEEDIREFVKEYGTVDRIELIAGRGCAFVTMTERLAAYKVLDRLKDKQLKSKNIKLDWAPGKGVKQWSEKEQYWESNKGAVLIPWENLPDNLSPLLEGGMLDTDSLPEHLKGEYHSRGKTGEPIPIASVGDGSSAPAVPTSRIPIPEASAAAPAPSTGFAPFRFPGFNQLHGYNQPPGFPMGMPMMPPMGQVPFARPMGHQPRGHHVMAQEKDEKKEETSEKEAKPSRWGTFPPENPTTPGPPIPGQPPFRPPGFNMHMQRGRFPSFRGRGPPGMERGGRFQSPGGFRGRGRGDWEPRGGGRGRGDWGRGRGGGGYGGPPPWQQEQPQEEPKEEEEEEEEEEPNPEAEMLAAMGLPTSMGPTRKLAPRTFEGEDEGRGRGFDGGRSGGFDRGRGGGFGFRGGRGGFDRGRGGYDRGRGRDSWRGNRDDWGGDRSYDRGSWRDDNRRDDRQQYDRRDDRQQYDRRDDRQQYDRRDDRQQYDRRGERQNPDRNGDDGQRRWSRDRSDSREPSAAEKPEESEPPAPLTEEQQQLAALGLPTSMGPTRKWVPRTFEGEADEGRGRGFDGIAESTVDEGSAEKVQDQSNSDYSEPLATEAFEPPVTHTPEPQEEPASEHQESVPEPQELAPEPQEPAPEPQELAPEPQETGRVSPGFGGTMRETVGVIAPSLYDDMPLPMDKQNPPVAADPNEVEEEPVDPTPSGPRKDFGADAGAEMPPDDLVE